MIIDAHAHGFHGGSIDRLAESGGKWSKDLVNDLFSVTRNKPHYFDVVQRLEQLDRNGISLQVVTPHHWLLCNLLPGDVEAKLKVARAINENMARLVDESGGRLLAAGSVPLQGFEHGGRSELEHAVKTLGIKAVSLPSNILGKPLDSPEFEPFWASVAQMSIPVYIHPGNPVGCTDRSYEDEFYLMHVFGWPFESTLALSRLVFSGIMERYPTLKILSHHLGGGMIPFFWGRIAESYGSADQEKRIGHTLPKPLMEYFSLFYYDTAVGNNSFAIECTCSIFGADRLIFATDYPWGPDTGEGRLASYPGIIESLSLSQEEKKRIFEDNAREIFDLT